MEEIVTCCLSFFFPWLWLGGGWFCCFFCFVVFWFCWGGVFWVVGEAVLTRLPSLRFFFLCIARRSPRSTQVLLVPLSFCWPLVLLGNPLERLGEVLVIFLFICEWSRKTSPSPLFLFDFPWDPLQWAVRLKLVSSGRSSFFYPSFL